MTAPPTPGAYLKHRREAARLSIADVAARLSTEPHEPEHLREQRLKLIEADAAPMTLTTIVALRGAYRFDAGVLHALEQHRQGANHWPRLCRICACSEYDGCVDAQGNVCAWVSDDLCSTCSDSGKLAA